MRKVKVEVEVKVVEALLGALVLVLVSKEGVEAQLFFARKMLLAQLLGQGEEEVNVGSSRGSGGGGGGVF